MPVISLEEQKRRQDQAEAIASRANWLLQQPGSMLTKAKLSRALAERGVLGGGYGFGRLLHELPDDVFAPEGGFTVPRKGRAEARGLRQAAQHHRDVKDLPKLRARFEGEEINEASAEDVEVIEAAEYLMRIPMDPLEELRSDMLEWVEYDSERMLLRAKFRNGGQVVVYKRVHISIFWDLQFTYDSGRSIGARFWDLIRNYERRSLPAPTEQKQSAQRKREGVYYPKRSNFVRRGGKQSFIYTEGSRSTEHPDGRGERGSYMKESPFTEGRERVSDRRLKEEAARKEAKELIIREHWEIDPETGRPVITKRQRAPGGGRKPIMRGRRKTPEGTWVKSRFTRKQEAAMMREIRDKERAKKVHHKMSKAKQKKFRKENEARAAAKKPRSGKEQERRLAALIDYYGGERHNIGVTPRGE